MSAPAYLSFWAAGTRYAVPVSEVREAARVPMLTPLPGSAARCAGVALVRGTPVAVLEVEERRSDSGTARGGLVLVLENRPFALLVDRVEGVGSGAADAIVLDLNALAAAPEGEAA